MAVRPQLLALVAALLLPAAAAAQPAATATYRITGHVATADAGLLADATVVLTRATPAPSPECASDADAPGCGSAAPNGPGQWTVRSGARGAFAFDALSPGRYRLRATRAGYTGREMTPQGIFRNGLDVILDRDATGIELLLRRSAAIAGRIVLPDGSAAAGVQVALAVEGVPAPVYVPDTLTTSEWDGRYEIDGLPPGEYRVLAMPRARAADARGAGIPAGLEFTAYPGVPAREGGGAVRVFEGVPVEAIDIWLTPAPQRFTVSGRLFPPDGVAATNVVIEYGGAPGMASGIWHVNDPGGLFTIAGVSPGTLVMLARAESAGGPLAGFASTDISVGDVEDVRLFLQRPGAIGGRVMFDPAAAGAGPDPRTLRVALVQALLKVSPLYPAEHAAVTEAGSFRIEEAVGEYTFVVHGLPDGWRLLRVQRDGRPLSAARVRIGAGEMLTGIELVVGPPQS